jgi:hypothetical protein
MCITTSRPDDKFDLGRLGWLVSAPPSLETHGLGRAPGPGLSLQVAAFKVNSAHFSVAISNPRNWDS